MEHSICNITQELHPGTLVLLRNNVKDGRKGDKLVERWLGPYKIAKHLNKGVYILENRCTGQILKLLIPAGIVLI